MERESKSKSYNRGDDAPPIYLMSSAKTSNARNGL